MKINFYNKTSYSISLIPEIELVNQEVLRIGWIGFYINIDFKNSKESSVKNFEPFKILELRSEKEIKVSGKKLYK